MKLEEAIKIMKPATEGLSFAADLVLVMTKSAEFEETARYFPVSWHPEKVVGVVSFIDGHQYRVVVERVKTSDKPEVFIEPEVAE